MSRSVDPDSLGFVITDVGRLLRAAVEKRIAQNGTDVTPGEARARATAVLDEAMESISAEERGAFETVLRTMRGSLQAMLGCDRQAREDGEAA